ncbi:hypothetical protein J2793_001742 [Paraburkholderia caledonica]|uniref:Uncharacterized protein n=1 Tax=Paraburkholderia caledonica TaxID=134536 RepID=A0AB73I8N6_9BURK|nr:hypothetical protein [Paraburkholderia caledonica]
MMERRAQQGRDSGANRGMNPLARRSDGSVRSVQAVQAIATSTPMEFAR